MRPSPEVLIEFHERAPRIGLLGSQRPNQRGVTRIPVIGHRDTLYVAGAQEAVAEPVTMPKPQAVASHRPVIEK
jgi:hypothetical protein